MFGRRFDLFTVFGVTIRVDASWFVVAALVTWSLGAGSFPFRYPSLEPATHWLMGIAGALGLFGSIVLHELGHALMARQYGLSIRGITLFIFGGVAEMESEPPSAKAEFLVAVAGPAVTIMIGTASAIGFALLWLMTGSWAVAGVLEFVARMNLYLVLFNMVPAFPLDGGRVLRSILWLWKKDLRWATAISARIGSGFGVMLIAFGVYLIVARQGFVGGMWMCLIGMFLRNAAQMSHRQVLLRHRLEGERIRRFMQTDPLTVPRALSVADLVQHYVYRYHFELFPVVDNGRLIGCVTIRQIKELPQSEWPNQSVGAITIPCSTANTISPDSDALSALTLMSRHGASRLMVVEEGRLVGIVVLKDLLAFLTLKDELEG